MTRAWQLGLTGSFMVHLAMLLGYYMLPGYTARPAGHPAGTNARAAAPPSDAVTRPQTGSSGGNVGP